VANQKARPNWYELALSAFEKFYEGDGSTQHELEKLRPHLKSLRDAYHAFSVRPAYNSATAWAYLLAYVPPYILLTEHVLREFNFFEEFTSGDLEVCIVGVGPGPEMVAVKQFFSEKSGGKSTLSFHLYDINHSVWSKVRRALMEVADDHFGIENQQHIVIDLDFNQPIDQQDLQRWFGRAKYLIFQNCFNELKNHDIAATNFRGIWEVLGKGSRIMIVDQNVNNYRESRSFWNQIKTFVESTGSDEVREQREQAIRFPDPVPSILQNNFFGAYEDFLVARRNIKFDALMLQKGTTR